jgi:hypothetical protein
MEQLKTQDAKAQVAKLMATGYSIPEKDALSMLGDAHSTNYAENREFFLNQNNPTNFERTWNTAYFLYRKIGSVSGNPVPFDQIMDFSVIQKLAGEPFYANQKNEYQVQFVPTSATAVQAESNEILTKSIVIQFYPNSDDIEKTIEKTVDGILIQIAVDTNACVAVRSAARVGSASTKLPVSTRTSPSSVSNAVTFAKLDAKYARVANAVKQALTRKFPSLQPPFTTAGRGGIVQPTRTTRTTTRRIDGSKSRSIRSNRSRRTR